MCTSPRCIFECCYRLSLRPFCQDPLLRIRVGSCPTIFRLNDWPGTMPCVCASSPAAKCWCWKIAANPPSRSKLCRCWPLALGTKCSYSGSCLLGHPCATHYIHRGRRDFAVKKKKDFQRVTCISSLSVLWFCLPSWLLYVRCSLPPGTASRSGIWRTDSQDGTTSSCLTRERSRRPRGGSSSATRATRLVRMESKLLQHALAVDVGEERELLSVAGALFRSCPRMARRPNPAKPHPYLIFYIVSCNLLARWIAKVKAGSRLFVLSCVSPKSFEPALFTLFRCHEMCWPGQEQGRNV